MAKYALEGSSYDGKWQRNTTLFFGNERGGGLVFFCQSADSTEAEVIIYEDTSFPAECTAYICMLVC